METIRSSNESSHEPEPDVAPTTSVPDESESDDAEFKITVKKLDTVVRPRGVLAE